MRGTIGEVAKTATYTPNIAVDGRCQNCGECCTEILPLTQKELKRLKRYAKEHGLKEHFEASLFERKTTLDFTCPFRDSFNKRCEVYPARPEICRSFICSRTQEAAIKNLERVTKGRKEYSLRSEIFGDHRNVEYFAASGFLFSERGKRMSGKRVEELRGKRE